MCVRVWVGQCNVGILDCDLFAEHSLSTNIYNFSICHVSLRMIIFWMDGEMKESNQCCDNGQREFLV